MDAAVYARISLDLKGEGLGVERQLEDCRALAKRKGWTVVDEYVDNDISASSGKERPEYVRMLDDIRSGRIRAVVVYALDRLTRKPAELETFIDLSERHGISLANITGDVDLSTANGKMVARMLGALARGEAERMGERIKREQLQAAQAGKKHQGRHRVFGYDRKFNIVEAEAAVVSEAFTRRAKGESATAIAIDFNDRGIKTLTGGSWDASGIVKMIRRRDYIAEITVNGEVVGPAAFKAVVDRPTWDLANQKVEDANNRGNNARKSLLAGFLVCGECFTKMKSGNTKDGPVYRCPGKAVPGSCGSCSIAGLATDSFIFNAAWRKEQEGEPPTPDVPARDFKAEAKAIQDEIDAAQAMYDAGDLSLTDLVPILNTNRNRLAKLQREEAATVSHDLGHMQMLFDWDDWNLSQQRLWLEKYVAYVIVSKADPSMPKKGYKPQRLEVHYKDGAKERLSRGVVVDSWPKERAQTAVRLCDEEDCLKTTYSKGLCATHYKAAWRRAKSAKAPKDDTELS